MKIIWWEFVTLTLSKLAYVGMCFVALSKVIMYKFHYDYLKNKSRNNSRLLFTDTDSLMSEIKTEDVYDEFKNDKRKFDFSNYLPKSKYYDDSNKFVTGKMKDKTSDTAIAEFARLKPDVLICGR